MPQPWAGKPMLSLLWSKKFLLINISFRFSSSHIIQFWSMMRFQLLTSAPVLKYLHMFVGDDGISGSNREDEP